MLLVHCEFLQVLRQVLVSTNETRDHFFNSKFSFLESLSVLHFMSKNRSQENTDPISKTPTSQEKLQNQKKSNSLSQVQSLAPPEKDGNLSREGVPLSPKFIPLSK